MIHVGVQLFVATVFALYTVFVAQAVYDGLRDRMQFKAVPVTVTEVVGIVVLGAVVMAAGYDAVGAGIMLGGLLALGAMNLIYMSARTAQPSRAAAHTR